MIVRADATNKLNENAYAALHSGDTYFANSKLESWEIKYCLDNDTNRFIWADTTNGKGVIYYMKDEWNNECPYDFKNIMFKDSEISISGIKANVFYYTFSVASGTNDATITDHSLNGMYCYENKMGRYCLYNKSKLNANVFRSESSTNNCRRNIFSYGCYSNTFGKNCNNITFGNGCHHNSFGHSCGNITFESDCFRNSFGNSCQYNSFGHSCQYNSFGNYCIRNSFGVYCQYNSFGEYCQYNSFGNGCQYITFSKDCCQYNIVENGNQYINVTSTQSTSLSNKLRNFTIAQGVNNTSTVKTISHDTVNDTFQTIYQPANSQVISV